MKTLQIYFVFILLIYSFSEIKAQKNSKIDSLTQLYNSAKQDTDRIVFLTELAVEIRNTNLDSTFAMSQRALAMSEKLNFTKGKGRALRVIGIYYLMKGNNKEALNNYVKANQFSRQVDDKFNIAWSHINMGTIYKIIGDNAKALENYFDGLKIFEEMKNRRGIGWVYSNIGAIYSNQSDNVKALEYYQKSLKVREEIGNKQDIVVSLNNLGAAYNDMKDYPKALESLEKSLALSSEIKDFVSIIVASERIANINIKQQRFDSAIKHLEEGLAVAKKIDNRKEIIELYTTFSKYHNIHGDAQKAFTYSQQALDLAKASSNLEYIRNASEQVSISCAKLGKYKDAYESFALFKKTTDSLSSEASYKKTLLLDFQFQENRQRAEQEKKDIEAKNEINRQKIIRNTFFGGFVLVIVLVFFVFRSYRIKRRANELLSAQNNEINQQKEEIAAQRDELENSYLNIKVLSEMGKKITAEINLEKIIETTYDNINSLMDASVFGIGFYEEEKNRISFPGTIEKGIKLPFFHYSTTDKTRVATNCFNNSTEIIINDFKVEYSKYIEQFREAEVGETPSSIIYLPLLARERKIGVITVQSFVKSAYTDYHVYILKNIMVYIAIAYENAEAFKKIELQKAEITEKNEELNQLNEEIGAQRDALETQNIQISEKNEFINSSIQYAKTIQQAILPSIETIKKDFDCFIVYRPKDIVSGDFYWYHKVFLETKPENTKSDLFTIPNSQLIFVAVVDCTGHGVPGAFMSMIANRLLNNIVVEQKIYNPDQVLYALNNEVIKALQQQISENQDGMDLGLCVIEQSENKNLKLYFSGAKNPLFYYSSENKKVRKVSADRKSIGGITRKDYIESFHHTELKLYSGDIIYLSTDGYIDQNNALRKRIGTPRFIEILNRHAPLSLTEQQLEIEKELDNWQGQEEQRDDITVVGLKF